MRYIQRRRMCRVLFCVLCALPTLLIGGLAAILNTPSYRAVRQQQLRDQLSRRLGVEVKFASCQWSNTRQWVLHKVELLDPESHAPLASIRSVAAWQTAGGWQVELGQPELDAARLPRLVEILHEHVLQRSDVHLPCELTAATAVLRDEPYMESLLDVRLVSQGESDAAELFLEFRPAAAESEQPVRLRVVRNRQMEPAATGWELHCETTALPCQLARSWIPQLRHLGSECCFRGSIWAENLAAGWEAELAGEFQLVDLDSLVSQQYAHKLSGVATLAIDQMLVREGRIKHLEGQLASSGGTVGLSLLEAAEEHLRLKRCLPSAQAPRMAYRDLWFEFVLDEAGLVFSGRDDLTHTVMADSQGPLLTSPQPVRVPPQAIVRALVPLADYEVPATQETTALLQALPLPSANPRVPVTSQRGPGPLRLIKTQ